MASSSQSLNRHGDDHNNGNLRRVTRARHAANTKGKGMISTSADHHQDEYGDELNRELNRERNEGGELADERADELVDERADQDRDVCEEVRELSTKLDTLLTSFKTYDKSRIYCRDNGSTARPESQSITTLTTTDQFSGMDRRNAIAIAIT